MKSWPLIFLFISMFSPAHAYATVLRACSLSLPPQTMLDSQGQPDGLAVKTLQAVARQLNWNLSIDYMPWMRVVHGAQRGECDLVLTALRRPDYEDFMAFPATPILDQANVLVIRHGAAVHFDGDLEAFMRRYSLGIYQDKAVNPQFEQLRYEPWARILLSNSPQQNIERLLAGRFDAVVENDLTAFYALRSLGREEKISVLSPALSVTPAYVTFPLAGKAIGMLKVFDQALSDFKGTREFQTLQLTYLGH